ncbi:MAG TPA: hypothetical protein VLT90_09650 [Terriglobales bacterium]|nr:hypothetical protein [Terriglobales bacterium]
MIVAHGQIAHRLPIGFDGQRFELSHRVLLLGEGVRQAIHRAVHIAKAHGLNSAIAQ